MDLNDYNIQNENLIHKEISFFKEVYNTKILFSTDLKFINEIETENHLKESDDKIPTVFLLKNLDNNSFDSKFAILIEDENGELLPESEIFKIADDNYCKMIYSRYHGIPMEICCVKAGDYELVVKELSLKDVDNLMLIIEGSVTDNNLLNNKFLNNNFSDINISNNKFLNNNFSDINISNNNLYNDNTFIEKFYFNKEEALSFLDNYIMEVYGFYNFGIWGLYLKQCDTLIGIAGFTPRDILSDSNLQQTEDDNLNLHPTEDDNLNLHPTEDGNLNLHPTEDSNLNLRPTEDSNLNLHPTEDNNLNSHQSKNNDLNKFSRINILDNNDKMANWDLELGYALSYQYQGKGIAFHSLKAIIDYAVQNIDFNKIYVDVERDNIKSLKLAEKLQQFYKN